ncbi:MAG: hypothetical protein HYT65_01700 [Candidatus Yanofskybacteria bacterium]|nr:hypothetical protein [Candidatus Yanofskybacteria bacterium]
MNNMKKNRRGRAILVILFIYLFYFLFGVAYNGYKEKKYIKKAQEKADVNRNGKLEIEEVLAVYKSFDYDGERLLHTVGSYENQAILIAKLAQTDNNKSYIAEFTIDPVKPFNSWDFLRALVDVDNDKDGRLSFEEGAAALSKLYEAYPDESCPLRLLAQRPTSSQSSFLFQIFFNVQNLTYGSELQRYATGQ